MHALGAHASEIKLHASVSGKTGHECNATYSAPEFNGQIRLEDNLQMCAGSGRSDSCNGDSGGPLMVSEKYDCCNACVYAVGIVSFGLLSCGELNYPGVYTRIGPYINWIVDHLEP